MTATLLAGCATSGSSPDLRLAAVPQDIRQCFRKLTQRPAGDGALTDKEVVEIIGNLRRSELRLSGCGQRLIKLYDDQAEALLKAVR